jgi:hypothetical protein
VRQTLVGGWRDVSVETTPDDRYAIFASASVYFPSLLQVIDRLANTELARAILTGPSREIAEALAVPPVAPTGLAHVVAGRTVTLSWSLPGTSSAAVEFVVEAGSRPGAADLARSTVDGVASSLTVPDVPPGRYWVRVRAVNYTGTSAPSNEIVVEVR